MSEEEFNAEVKRVIREWTGETREPAYDLGEASSPFDVIGDAAQMAEWEARCDRQPATRTASRAPLTACRRARPPVRYGRTGDTPASSPEKVHEAAGQRAADGDEDGMVELDLMGGGASPAKTVDPSLDLSFGGAVRAAPCPRTSLASGRASARLRAGAAPGD